MIDATHLKAHRTAASLLKKGDVPRRIGRTKGGLNYSSTPSATVAGRRRSAGLEHRGARHLLFQLFQYCFSIFHDTGDAQASQQVRWPDRR